MGDNGFKGEDLEMCAALRLPASVGGIERACAETDCVVDGDGVRGEVCVEEGYEGCVRG